MRGKLCQCCLRRPRSRITPAGAGKTIRRRNSGQRARDHPRRCGENFCTLTPAQGANRITPAGAGKTSGRDNYDTAAKDHPRRCGENRFSNSITLRVPGSPPQVRGKLTFLRYLLRRVRITPAGAGKTDCKHLSRLLHWDHPRRCGENGVTTIGSSPSTGSPPQVRGKLPV